MGNLLSKGYLNLEELDSVNWQSILEGGGMLMVDKPVGITSHDVVAIIRRYITKHVGTKTKIGHAGTLDPLASGLLLILIGKQATQRQLEFMKLPKVYQAEIWWGVTSDTFDLDGNLKVSPGVHFDGNLEQLIKRVLPRFQGEISQRVPAFSAVKVAGSALYKKARHSYVNPEMLPIKTVSIESIEYFDHRVITKQAMETWCGDLMKKYRLSERFGGYARKQSEHEQKLTQAIARLEMSEVLVSELRVSCSSGTYIRSLISDLGAAVGCGAAMAALRRISVGGFHLEDTEFA